jgi:hypothetical protein
VADLLAALPGAAAVAVAGAAAGAGAGAIANLAVNFDHNFDDKKENCTGFVQDLLLRSLQGDDDDNEDADNDDHTTCEGFTAVRRSRFGHSGVATTHRDGDKPGKIST